MQYLTIKARAIISGAVTIMLLTPIVSSAQPAGPGGSDPFAVPVNGGVAFIAAIAFLYGVYKIYQLAKRNAENPDR